MRTLPRIADTRMKRRAWLVAAEVATTSFQLHAADRVVRLAAPPEFKSEIAALPPIAEPADNAERKITAALHRFDASVLKATAECNATGSKHILGANATLADAFLAAHDHPVPTC